MKKYLPYSLMIPVVALSLASAGIASAHGWFNNATPDEIATHQQQMFQEKAQMLGISVDQMKDAWAQGKTLSDIAKEQGITEEQLKEKMKTAMQAKMKEHLQILVDKGIITQAQADARLKAIQEGKGMLMGKGKFRGGMHLMPM